MGAGCCKEEAIDFTSEIGKGAFGKVRVVQHKKTKEIYALKYINKAKCIRMRAVENIIQERRLLEEVEFSLICNLRYAFQDDENLFMVLDLMLGGDLRFHLERAGPMKEEVVRFYVAELALALDALHSRRIIHRDLKPDNVLLDEHGHAHLTDFNIAVYYNPSKPLVSIAGSMAYMAPEVLMRKGYFESVDWWSLGVVMFELLFGRLCERDISKRLGCTPEGLDAFKQHPWFQGIEWDKLVTKEAIPPFEPDSKKANFDATHELEELLMEDNPLKAKKRAQTSPEVELSSEMQLMEDKFIIYDFSKVKRSHSLSRPTGASGGGNKNLPRSGSAGHGHVHGQHHESKMSMSSATLDGVLTTRNSSGRIEHLPSMAGANATGPGAAAAAQGPTKMYRSDSPSDLVGRERFNPDEDQLITTILTVTTSASGEQNVDPAPPSTSQSLQPLSKTPSRETQDTVVQPEEESEFLQEEQRGVEEPVAAKSVKPTSADSRTLGASQQQQQQQEQQPATSANVPYAASTTPSSPSNSLGSSTLSTPSTTYNSSPAPSHPHKHGAAGTVLFTSPDSGTSLSTMGGPFGSSATPLMDSVTISNTPVTPRSRALRGREPSQGNTGSGVLPKGGRAFELSSQAQNERHHHLQGQQQVQAPNQQQRQQQHHLTHQKTASQISSVHGRPMSAYTTSTSNVGSFHEAMMEFQETRSMTLAYQPHPFRASISGGLEGLSGGLRRGSLDGMSSGGNNNSLPPPLPSNTESKVMAPNGGSHVAVATAESALSEEGIKTSSGGPGMATISL
ncbi:hypothetical protein KI688_008473 [Linnemannia hyalina]|uniref:Kinase-like protein n=1 Tax=Linnemannia hyalina TaxID=64524 RepID=A0A9P8BWI4_9FUNG|nr:hypothetical protein KI688_008473 [Linnemannia hyalina]